MKHVSEFSGHDQAAGKQIPTPTGDDMKGDLDVIDAYRASVKKRGDAIASTRKALEEPPEAKVA